MTEEKDVRNEKSNEILMIKNYFLRKLEKAEKLLEPVEGFVFGGGIPSPVDTKQAYDLLLFVYQRMPGFFMGENVFLWEKLGWAYHLLGDIKKARQCLLIQAELQPGCADAYLNLAGFYDSRAMHTLAVKTYLDGLAECPGDEFLSFNLAQLLRNMGDFNTAVKYVNAAIRKNPERAYNHKLKGDILKNAGAFREAAESYEQALKLFGPANENTGDQDPEHQDAYYSYLELKDALHDSSAPHYRIRKVEEQEPVKAEEDLEKKKKLITLISSEGKSTEQLTREMMEALETFENSQEKTKSEKKKKKKKKK